MLRTESLGHASLCRRRVGPIWRSRRLRRRRSCREITETTVVVRPGARRRGLSEAFRTGTGRARSSHVRVRGGVRWTGAAQELVQFGGLVGAFGAVRWRKRRPGCRDTLGTIDFDFEREELPGCWNVWTALPFVATRKGCRTRECGLREAPDQSETTSRVERDQLLYVVERRTAGCRLTTAARGIPAAVGVARMNEPAVWGWIPAETSPRGLRNRAIPRGRTVPGRPYILSVGEMKCRSDFGAATLCASNGMPGDPSGDRPTARRRQPVGQEETEVHPLHCTPRASWFPGSAQRRAGRAWRAPEEMQDRCSTFYSKSACAAASSTNGLRARSAPSAERWSTWRSASRKRNRTGATIDRSRGPA